MTQIPLNDISIQQFFKSKSAHNDKWVKHLKSKRSVWTDCVLMLTLLDLKTKSHCGHDAHTRLSQNAWLHENCQQKIRLSLNISGIMMHTTSKHVLQLFHMVFSNQRVPIWPYCFNCHSNQCHCKDNCCSKCSLQRSIWFRKVQWAKCKTNGAACFCKELQKADFCNVWCWR